MQSFSICLNVHLLLTIIYTGWVSFLFTTFARLVIVEWGFCLILVRRRWWLKSHDVLNHMQSLIHQSVGQEEGYRLHKLAGFQTDCVSDQSLRDSPGWMSFLITCGGKLCSVFLLVHQNVVWLFGWNIALLLWPYFY